MFKHDFQGSPFFEIFSSNGQLSQNWKFVNRTFIGKTYDAQVKGYCYSCDKIGRLSLPKDKSSIYLIQPFLNLQLYIPQGANFSLELLISDLSGDRRRFFLSTAQYETKINALHVNLPIPGLLRGKWVNVVFDLASLMNENFRNQVFRSLNGLTLSGTFKLRKIFTLKFRPPDTSGSDVLDYDYANRHIEAIPRAVSFPIGVENIAQIFNMNRILIPVSKSNPSLKPVVQKETKRLDKKSVYNASVDNITTDMPRKPIIKSLQKGKSCQMINDKSINQFKSPKIIQKLPPINCSVGNKEYDMHPQPLFNLENNRNTFSDIPEPCPIDAQQEKTVYDPNLYSSPKNLPEISTADQLQNEIDDYLKNRHVENIEKNNDQVQENSLNVSNTSYNQSHIIPSRSAIVENKPCYISDIVGPSSPQPSASVGKSQLNESYNQNSSDDELHEVAASLNNLLSDLKQDSEATLIPALDKGSKDWQFDLSAHGKSRRDDSVYFSSDEESEGNLELVFDPFGNSFTDSRTGKRYVLDD